MIVKTHQTEDKRILLVVCDNEILGKKFEEGNKQLDLTSDFYKGIEKTELEVCDLMRNCDMINLVGEKVINLAIKEGVIDSEHVKKISDIPYAQVVIQGL
ncbi:hypothetical protein CEE44_02600 [Candidatus Woesearchaeota archaeon B3_Woes]|nr:MAG: hypothetical protein CEE44_02600 [Candidatus Woesearchaeota archaeon B3_Woes]